MSVVGQRADAKAATGALNDCNGRGDMTERSHYISSQRALLTLREALAALLTYDAGLLPADRKINTAGSLPGQTLSRIHHDSRQQPEVVSAVPDLVHLPRGDGGPLLVLPESVQLCVEEAKTKEEAGVVVGEENKNEAGQSASLAEEKKGKKKKTWLQVFSTEQRPARRLLSRWRSVWLIVHELQRAAEVEFFFFFSYQRREFSVV